MRDNARVCGNDESEMQRAIVEHACIFHAQNLCRRTSISQGCRFIQRPHCQTIRKELASFIPGRFCGRFMQYHGENAEKLAEKGTHFWAVITMFASSPNLALRKSGLWKISNKKTVLVAEDFNDSGCTITNRETGANVWLVRHLAGVAKAIFNSSVSGH